MALIAMITMVSVLIKSSTDLLRLLHLYVDRSIRQWVSAVHLGITSQSSSVLTTECIISIAPVALPIIP